MIEWRFTPDDVARIRFAFSPATELVLSLIVLRSPDRHALHLRWVRSTRRLLADSDLTELFALVPIRGDIADFLTPPPISPLPEFAEELDMIRRTPAEQVAAETAAMSGVPRAVARRITDDPAGALDRITTAMQTYWEQALRPHWSRIRDLLEADVLWRARRITEGGAQALFADLHQTVVWHGDRLAAADPHDHSGGLSGEGLVLTPSVMCWPTVRKMVDPYQPMLIYPARGIGTLWETGSTPVPAALAALIGQTRARILIALADPRSTTALAQRLAITPGAVSQHLTILLDSGLVARSRTGRTVLYRRTATADALLVTHA
jgi:DNA-binding transcriptional ArsR family regulator